MFHFQIKLYEIHQLHMQKHFMIWLVGFSKCKKTCTSLKTTSQVWMLLLIFCGNFYQKVLDLVLCSGWPLWRDSCNARWSWKGWRGSKLSSGDIFIFFRSARNPWSLIWCANIGPLSFHTATFTFTSYQCDSTQQYSHDK